MDTVPSTVVPYSAVELIRVTNTFEDLYRQEFPGLVAVAAVLTGDTRDSEDLVQDTMVKALVRWKHVGRLDRPGGWCHHVLLNACRSWWRRRHREARHLAARRRDDAIVNGPSPDAIAFWTAVRQLPARPRAAVALHFAGDLTTAEVAEVLQVPEGTVRSDIARARGFVMRALGEDG